MIVDVDVAEEIFKEYKSIIMEDKEEITKRAYEIYLTESRKEVDALIRQGCFVNYREFSYEQFLNAGCDKNNPWFSMFSSKFNQYFEAARSIRYAVYEKLPAHGSEVNGIILCPFNSKEDAENARNKYGYGNSNYYIDIYKN